MWVIVRESESNFVVGHYAPVRPNVVGPDEPEFIELITYPFLVAAVQLVNILNGGDGKVDMPQ